MVRRRHRRLVGEPESLVTPSGAGDDFALRSRPSGWLTRGALAVAAVLLGVLALRTIHVPKEHPLVNNAVSLAVLGNSDSHAYHDTVWFAPDSPERGGANRAVTLQWTEILRQLRPTELDPGEWATVGRSARVARVAQWFGMHVRSPRKQDFAYNFAFSGARCEHLGGTRGQTAALLHTIRSNPNRWANGVVIIRIGINDVGTKELLADVSVNGLTTRARRIVEDCGVAIRGAVFGIRAASPATQIVLIGIDDNVNWPPNFDQFHSAEQMSALTVMHDAFDRELKTLAAHDSLVRFYDERAWFRSLWGGRTSTGDLDYRSVSLGGIEVTMSQGDGLSHAVIADGHAGTLTNAVWARDLVTFLHDHCGLSVTPISTDELNSFVRSLRLAKNSP